MNAVSSIYKGKLRVRVAGLLRKGDELLLAQVHSPISNKTLWMPPGGGVEFGEQMLEALEREFMEETNLRITVGELRFINELLEGDFHAIEFFFDVFTNNINDLCLGIDPEHNVNQQILKDIQFVRKEELAGIAVVPKFLLKEYWKGETGRNF